MSKQNNILEQKDRGISNQHLNIKIKRLGIVSRDYRFKENNGYRDFSYSFEEVLKCLDSKGCDSVLFSLFTIDKRDSFRVKDYLSDLSNIQSVFVEEFVDKVNAREQGVYFVYYKTREVWQEYELSQKFGTLKYTNKFENHVINPFVSEFKTKRVLGNCALLLCGETNIVKYSKESKSIKDTFNLLDKIPENVTVLLNPIHDKMTRFEMKLKRQFLSKNDKWVVSVWNKGKEDKNGKLKDGNKPPWAVFYNGEKLELKRVHDCTISSNTKIEIGILDINSN